MRSIIAYMMIVLSLAPTAVAGPLDQSDLFQPDGYPSEVSAAQGLARRLVSMLSTRDFGAAGQSVRIGGNASPQAHKAVADIIAREFPPVAIDLETSASSAAKDALHITVEIFGQEDVTSPFRSIKDLKKGSIALMVQGPDLRESFDARYIDKPWVADWAAFSNGEPKGRWIIGQNETLATSEPDALKVARKHAARVLWDPVRERMNARVAGMSGKIYVTENWVVRHVEELLRSDEYLADRFVQTFDRPYGRLWRASILVDASTKNINEIAEYCAREARAEFGNRAVTFGSMAGLVGVIVLLYFLVNALTKGYFLWRLRAFALLLGIFGILIVLAVR